MRNCGACSLCCKAIRVKDNDGSLLSEAGEWCPRCDSGVGCRIYEDRPPGCRAFVCQWLCGAFEDGDRPDKLGVVYHLTSEGEVKAFESHPFARSRDRNRDILSKCGEAGYRITVTCVC